MFKRAAEVILIILGLLTLIIVGEQAVDSGSRLAHEYIPFAKVSGSPVDFTFETTRSVSDPWINFTDSTLAFVTRLSVPADFINLTEQRFIIWKNCSNGATYGGGNAILKSNSTGNGPDYSDYVTAGLEGRYFTWQFNNSDPANEQNGSYVVHCYPNATYWSSNGGGILLNNSKTINDVWWIIEPAQGYTELFTAIGNASNSAGFYINGAFEFVKCNTPYVEVDGQVLAAPSITPPVGDDDDDSGSSDSTKESTTKALLSVDQIIAIIGIVLPVLGGIMGIILQKQKAIKRSVNKSLTLSEKILGKFQEWQDKMKYAFKK